ncbi:MAG: hypothetical protein KBA81_05040, partial [Rhabdochlamydiaceae bacterium]|nr:hypothetical protein [Rhabdochlamydiaceae bacterium]
MNIIDRQGKINLNSTPVGYEFIHQGKDYQFPTLEKVHEFFFTETKLDTVKLCHQGKKSYVHFTLDEIETFSSKKALRRILSQESEGAWIEKRDGKKKYFVDNGWLFSSIKKVSKEEYQNRPEKGLTFQKVLGVALGLFAIAPAAVECARRMPVGTQEAAMGLIAMQHRSPLLAVLGYSLLPQLSRAQAVGMEFQVNNYVLSDQSAPNVAPLKDGGFLVTWRSYGQDGDGYGIYAKRYNANGIQIGLEFRVNSNTTNSQSDPCAASLNDGGFVIAWTSNGQDGDGSGIYAQRYDATSIRIGTEFRVNNYTTNNQYSPRVAPLEDGGFIIVWTSEYQDGDFTGVYGQRYNVSGLKNSAEFLVNTRTLNVQQDPSITALKNKKVIVAWTSYGQDGDSGGTYAQMYDASIVPNGTEFQVNTYTTGTQGYPSIAALMDGGFVTTWLSFAQDGDGWGIFGQKYDFNRAQIGLEFQINNYTISSQERAQVAHFGNLGFVVTWMGQDGDLNGIFAQIFDIIGLKNGTEFQVNNYTTSYQSYPSIASLEYGGFVIIWQSQDQDGSGIG